MRFEVGHNSHESVVNKWEEIFFFRLERVTLYFCFSQRVNSNRGHKSSLLVLTFTKYLEVAIVLFLYANVMRYFYFMLQRVI